MSLGHCAAVLKTASRANPALHLPYRPRARATPRTASRNVRRYDWTASSGSVVANDPVNMTDPDGKEGACMYGPSMCGLRQTSEADRATQRGILSTLADFIPIIGDAKAGYEAYQNPTAVNIIVAGIGVVPGFGDAAGKVIKQLERGAATLERRALQHEAKLADFKQNPTVRPGMEGRSPQEIAKQQGAREAHLKQEIANFKQQAEEKRQMAEQLRRKLNE